MIPEKLMKIIDDLCLKLEFEESIDIKDNCIKQMKIIIKHFHNKDIKETQDTLIYIINNNKNIIIYFFIELFINNNEYTEKIKTNLKESKVDIETIYNYLYLYYYLINYYIKYIEYNDEKLSVTEIQDYLNQNYGEIEKCININFDNFKKKKNYLPISLDYNRDDKIIFNYLLINTNENYTDIISHLF